MARHWTNQNKCLKIGKIQKWKGLKAQWFCVLKNQNYSKQMTLTKINIYVKMHHYFRMLWAENWINYYSKTIPNLYNR